jgi:hypothetical protein
MLNYKVKHFILQIKCINIKKNQKEVNSSNLIKTLINFKIKVKIINFNSLKKELKKFLLKFNNIF